MEQQYTCPSCHKDYTRFTIAEHYGCGVEPLEIVEESDPEESGTQETEEGAQATETQATKPEPKKRGRKPKVVA